ncbi:MAG: hypothetical protein JSV25_11905 [Spirochaetota bacterium]|nr:MAG: hypothetical protein JSV25_11905 [Spirochaetota bacterium]
MKRIVPLLMVFSILVLAGACATNISTIKQNPVQYANRTVTISGTVTKVHLVPNSRLNLLAVYDETDTIVVLTDEEVKKNQDVTVSGEIVAIGGRITGQRATYLQRKIADFLVANKITTQRRSLPTSKMVLAYLRNVLPKARNTLLLLESTVY